jgi:hypothetical protein
VKQGRVLTLHHYEACVAPSGLHWLLLHCSGQPVLRLMVRIGLPAENCLCCSCPPTCSATWHGSY